MQGAVINNDRFTYMIILFIIITQVEASFTKSKAKEYLKLLEGTGNAHVRKKGGRVVRRGGRR